MTFARASLALQILLFSACSGVSRGDTLLDAAPLAVRNTAPLGNLYGLPRAGGARLLDPGQHHHQLIMEIANNFTDEVRNGVGLFLDGETAVASYRFQRAVGAGWELGVEVPYVTHYGGFLDPFIDDFHELFGFPDGNRDTASRGELDFFVRLDGESVAMFTQSRHGLGDVRLQLGRQLWTRAATAGALRFQLKAPTGDLQQLTGSGGWDGAAWLELEQRAALGLEPLAVTFGAGAAVLGDSDVPGNRQRSWAPFGHFGLSLRLTPAVLFHGQLDAQGELWEGVDHAGDAVQGTLGGRVRLGPRSWLDLGVVEDLRSKSSSDVVFQFSLTSRW